MLTYYIVSWFIFCGTCTNTYQSENVVLKGVTLWNEPFISYSEDESQFSTGFLVELMDQIAQFSNFSYSLYLTPDGKYGVVKNGTANGMLGELLKKNAHFALADLHLIKNQESVIQFTEPYMDLHLSALVNTVDANKYNLCSLRDLLQSNLTCAILNDSWPYQFLSSSKHPTAVKLWECIRRSEPDSLIAANSETALSISRTGGRALILENQITDYYSGRICNLTSLVDSEDIFPRSFAIALPIGSPHVDKFNRALVALKANGTIAQLRRKYWPKYCPQRNC